MMVAATSRMRLPLSIALAHKRIFVERARLLDDLLARGLVRPNSLALGIDVDQHCRVINALGEARDDLFCIGPMSRGTFWEIIAIPDIRWQCHELARRLVEEKPAARDVPSFALSH